MKPADLLLVHSTGLIPRAIGLGERVHHAGPWTHWTHAALIVSEAGDTIEANSKGVVESHVDAHPDRVWLDSGLDDEDRAQAVAFAQACLGKKYGYLTIASIVLDILTPKALILRSPDTLICSELVARALEHGGWVSPELDTNRVMPSDLGMWFSPGGVSRAVVSS